MATDQRMNHCKHCQKTTLHVNESTSHGLHLFLTILNFGVSLFSVTLFRPLVVVLWVWPVVWFAVTLWHRAQSQCIACGKYQIAALPALALTFMFVLPLLAWTVLTITDPQQRIATKIGDGRTLSVPRPPPAENPDGVLRENFEQFLIVMPGIRPVANNQKRTLDVEDAFRNGADYILIGRHIRDAPHPRAAAEAFSHGSRRCSLGLGPLRSLARRPCA